MSSLRQPLDERKLLTVEQLQRSTGYPIRIAATAYLKSLLTRDDLGDIPRAAIHTELARRGVNR